MPVSPVANARSARLKTLLKANGGQAISELVPARHSSKSFKAQDRLEIQAEKAHLQKTCKLQNERLQDKRQELRALRYERETLEHKTNALEGENVALAGRRQELEARIAALETETTELRRENTVLAKKREDLEGRAAALESKNVQLAGQQDRLATELVITNLDERDMLDDGAVKNRWVGLENTVFNIAVQRYGVAPEPHVREPLEVFEGIVAEPHKWLTDGSRREWLIQAFIWNELVETVLGEYGFSARSYNLSGENRRVYSDYLKALRGWFPQARRPPRVDGVSNSRCRRVFAAGRHHAPPIPEAQSGHEHGPESRQEAQHGAHCQGRAGDRRKAAPFPVAGLRRRGMSSLCGPRPGRGPAGRRHGKVPGVVPDIHVRVRRRRRHRQDVGGEGARRGAQDLRHGLQRGSDARCHEQGGTDGVAGGLADAGQVGRYRWQEF